MVGISRSLQIVGWKFFCAFLPEILLKSNFLKRTTNKNVVTYHKENWIESVSKKDQEGKVKPPVVEMQNSPG